MSSYTKTLVCIKKKKNNKKKKKNRLKTAVWSNLLSIKLMEQCGSKKGCLVFLFESNGSTERFTEREVVRKNVIEERRKWTDGWRDPVDTNQPGGHLDRWTEERKSVFEI